MGDVGNDCGVGYRAFAELTGDFVLVSILERIGEGPFLVEVEQGALEGTLHGAQVLDQFGIGLADAFLISLCHVLDPRHEAADA